MTKPDKISELIERSSMGTAGARSLRNRTPPEIAQRILARAAERERTTEHMTAKPSNVADLLLRFSGGDPGAWDEMFHRYGKLVSTVVRSFRMQEADALDAVQMTWLRLFENAHRILENAHRIQFPERLGGWLATTARRECLHILRQVKPIPGMLDVTPDTVADPSAGPEEHVIGADTAETLRKLAAELPPRRRTLVRMLFTDQPRSYAEIIRTVGIPPGGLGPTRARALRQLHEYLAADEALVEQRLKPEQTAVTKGDSSLPKGNRSLGPQQHLEEADTAWTPGELDAIWLTHTPAHKTGMEELSIASDVLGPHVVVLPIPDVAQRLRLPVTRVHQMLRDGQLLGIRRQDVVVPAEFLSGDTVVKGLPGTITLLRAAGYSVEKILRWLFTVDDALLGTPISALRRDLAIKLLV